MHFVSLGCDKNLVDSEIMLGLLNEDGHEITPSPEDADVIVVNTCGFIAAACEEGIETILTLASHKRTGACKALVVAGCMAQRYKDELMEQMPEVDAVIGVGDIEAICRVIREAADGRRVCLVTDMNRVLPEGFIKSRVTSTPRYFAYVKIAEGCDNRCTYCAIPAIRGGYRSRRVEDIVDEAGRLAEMGAKELVLVAQDTACYGKDIYGESRLHELLSRLSAVAGVEWIRIMYAYPEHITPETINEMAVNPKVCHYLDMPVQHAHDGVLRRMGRSSSHEALLRVITNLRERMPDISLRTTLITGFPGETEQEFACLLDFVTQIKFDKLGVFEYSKEEGTVASKMDGQVSASVKKRRADLLMRTQKAISSQKCGQLVGSTIRVMAEGRLPGGDMYRGRGYMDAPDVDGAVFFRHEAGVAPGAFVDLEITSHSDYDLFGRVAEAKKEAGDHEFA